MTPQPLNLTILIKLMMMTTSDNDAEALNALRLANAALARQNSNWEDLLLRRLHLDATDPFANLPSSATKGIKHSNVLEIEGYFAALAKRNLGTFADYVNDVQRFWREKGYLTDKQYDVIRKSATRR